MKATKSMIKKEIINTFVQIKECAQRSGYIDSALENVARIEKECERIRYLIKEYNNAPDNWHDECEDSKEMPLWWMIKQKSN